MKPVWTNTPINQPQKQGDPALKALVVMISVIALMFGIRLFCHPAGDLEDVAAMLDVTPPDTQQSAQSIR